MQQNKFYRHMMRIGFNERINTVGISFEYALVVVYELFCVLCRDTMQTQAATEAVSFECNGAKYFGEPSRSYATVQFHLPEAVLSMHITLRQIKVIFRIFINIGDAVAISDNFNRLVQSTEMHCTILAGYSTSSEQRIGTTYEA